MNLFIKTQKMLNEINLNSILSIYKVKVNFVSKANQFIALHENCKEESLGSKEHRAS
jgi:hypothetical protein